MDERTLKAMANEAAQANRQREQERIRREQVLHQANADYAALRSEEAAVLSDLIARILARDGSVTFSAADRGVTIDDDLLTTRLRGTGRVRVVVSLHGIELHGSAPSPAGAIRNAASRLRGLLDALTTE